MLLEYLFFSELFKCNYRQFLKNNNKKSKKKIHTCNPSILKIELSVRVVVCFVKSLPLFMAEWTCIAS